MVYPTLYFLGANWARISHPPIMVEQADVGSVFVPFCAFKTETVMSNSSVWLPNISFPFCSSFQPTILEGQLCFKLEMNTSGGQGIKNGLLFLIDYQEDLSLQYSSDEEDQPDDEAILKMDLSSNRGMEKDAAKIHIDTLSPFKSYGGGSFKMTDVKRMTAKMDFLEMIRRERHCEVELYEDCRSRKLLEVCGCAPWELPLAFQVTLQQLLLMLPLYLQC